MGREPAEAILSSSCVPLMDVALTVAWHRWEYSFFPRDGYSIVIGQALWIHRDFEKNYTR